MNHGLDLSNPYLLAWVVIFPLAHAVLTIGFRALNFCPDLTPKRERGSDLVAVCLISAITMTFIAVVGTMTFFNINGCFDNAEYMKQDKLFARSPLLENLIIIPMICYQGWNICVSLIMAEFRTVDSIGHHIVTFFLAYLSMAPYCQYYTMFFFGVAEASSVPLNIMYIFKYVPQLAIRYPVIASQSRTIFGVSFIVVRLLIWPIICYDFWLACYKAYVTKKIHSGFAFGFFLFANTFLTFLQVYWGYLIVKGLLKKNSVGGKGGVTGGGKE